MVKLTVNRTEIEVENGTTVLQACEAAGIEIPRFCYHEKLAIAGNCRMCLVEVEKSPKPVASCAHPVAEGMVVHTDSPVVKKAREGVMEFLLINHPLDCPICDQGGECDLQDQAMKYGRGTSRFEEAKRAVVNKNLGPLISTNMNRCIHCTRCVRFLEDIAGTNELGAIGRGEHMEITTYIEHSITSELSANIIDLCPVGALTAKPHQFQFRSWELKHTQSIDVLDAVGSNIIINSRGTEVMRILPYRNDEINEEWISDKTRFACDGLRYQRLDVPMLAVNGKLERCTWAEAFAAIKEKITITSPQRVAAVAGDITDVETMCVAKELLNKIGSQNYDCRYDGSLLDNTERWLYTFNSTISGIEQADLCLIIGSNPRIEAAIINARIKKAVLHNKLKVALIGVRAQLNYDYEYLGNTMAMIEKIANGTHPFSTLIRQAKNPMIIVGAAVFSRQDWQAFVHLFKKLCSDFNVMREDWKGFNVLQSVASRVGGLDIGFVPGANGMAYNDIVKDAEVLFLFGADTINPQNIPEDTFVIYQGHHGEQGARRADVILPGAAYTEKDATYVNTEGRMQRTYKAVPPPYQAKADWQIINELAMCLGFDLNFRALEDVRNRMSEISPFLQDFSVTVESKYQIGASEPHTFVRDSLDSSIANFYMTDVISRHSKTMALCAQEILGIK